MPDDTYTGLTRDAAESRRLNLQHTLYIRAAGFHLHPRIAAHLPPDPHIAEVATGTGIWLRELAAQSPAAWNFTGLDLSPDQFPSSLTEAEKGRVEFKVLDVLEEVPEEMRGRFDVVHVRLLTCGLTTPAWTTCARNLHTLLKPHGWLQWHEGTFDAIHCLQTDPTTSTTTALTRLRALALAAVQAADKVLPGSVARLAETVRAAGFADVQDFVHASDREPALRGVGSEVEVGAMAALARWGVRAQSAEVMGGVGVEGVEEVVRGAWRELEEGRAYVTWEMHVVTGRKAG